jgi:hypothetical protein
MLLPAARRQSLQHGEAAAQAPRMATSTHFFTLSLQSSPTHISLSHRTRCLVPADIEQRQRHLSHSPLSVASGKPPSERRPQQQALPLARLRVTAAPQIQFRPLQPCAGAIRRDRCTATTGTCCTIANLCMRVSLHCGLLRSQWVLPHSLPKSRRL